MGDLKHGVDIPVVIDDKSHQVFQSCCLAPKVAGWANVLLEHRRRCSVQLLECQQFGRSQIPNGQFDVLPVGVLRQDGADHDFHS